jgi:hypothetical protein
VRYLNAPGTGEIFPLHPRSELVKERRRPSRQCTARAAVRTGRSPHARHKTLAAGGEVLVLAAQRLGQLPFLGADPHGQARPAQHGHSDQAPYVITGQRDPREHQRDPAVGRMAHRLVGPIGHHVVPELDLTSSDGTPIAYDRTGAGDPLILVGGALSYRTRGSALPLRTTVASRALRLGPFAPRGAHVPLSRASMAAALASGSRPAIVTCRSARSYDRLK